MMSDLDMIDRRRDEWKLCPHCRSPMLPLKDYEVRGGAGPDEDDSDTMPSMHRDWTESIIMGILDHIWDGVRTTLRKRKLLRLRRQLLPRSPNSLVCPRCLHAIERP
ncbi:MAG: hypothetical protein M3347_08980 [Armatimonadota bacterium]|nr:hypothetical protein [Armatimonadota bacterium]